MSFHESKLKLKLRLKRAEVDQIFNPRKLRVEAGVQIKIDNLNSDYNIVFPPAVYFIVVVIYVDAMLCKKCPKNKIKPVY